MGLHFDGKFWSTINERINCLAPLGRYVDELAYGHWFWQSSRVLRGEVAQYE